VTDTTIRIVGDAEHLGSLVAEESDRDEGPKGAPGVRGYVRRWRRERNWDRTFSLVGLTGKLVSPHRDRHPMVSLYCNHSAGSVTLAAMQAITSSDNRDTTRQILGRLPRSQSPDGDRPPGQGLRCRHRCRYISRLHRQQFFAGLASQLLLQDRNHLHLLFRPVVADIVDASWHCAYPGPAPRPTKPVAMRGDRSVASVPSAPATNRARSGSTPSSPSTPGILAGQPRNSEIRSASLLRVSRCCADRQ
jgi:hypothetical protein